MNDSRDDNELESALNEAFGSPPNVDFDAWRRQHSEAIAWLNPERINTLVSRRRLTSRTIMFVAAAAVLAVVWLGISQFAPHGSGTAAFAQVLDQIEKAKTVTWKTTFYDHLTSKDGKRTWITTETRPCAYRAPGLRREVILDDKMQIKSVTITDLMRLKKLHLKPATKEAVVTELAAGMQDPSAPFHWVQKLIKESNLAWVATHRTAAGDVNVFRHAFRNQATGEDWSYDFWIDPKTKRLVEVHVPGADIYDLDKDPARTHPPEERWLKGTPACHVDHDINFDAALDESLFALDPPEGYTVHVKRREQVTEKEVVDYLGIAADYNDKTFPDQVFPVVFPSDRLNKIWDKPKKDRTAAEQKLLDTDNHYKLANLNLLPIGHFVQDHTVEKSFRYLGKGVKLGEKDRIVCWYKLKGVTTYRVVYGDLSVKDVLPEALPLTVEP